VLEPVSGYLRLGQLLAAQPEISGEAFNFGPAANQNRTVLDLLTALSRHWHFAEGSEKFKVENSPVFKEATLLQLNCEKAERRLQWKPVLGFEEAAALTGDWYAQFYQNGKANLPEFTLAQLRFFVKTATERGAAWAFDEN
jgi:CDP-glucose 4,6-dehydratase